MKMTEAGLDLIKGSEGLRLEAYHCPAAKLTIGYGHTSEAGAPIVKLGMQITKEEAERILLADLVQYENAVKRLVKVSINDNQYSALVSLCYNIGERRLALSTVMTRVNVGDFDGAAKAFSMWNKGGGKVLPGLVTRRTKEAALFLTPVTPEPTPVKSAGLLGVLINFVLSFFKVSK